MITAMITQIWVYLMLITVVACGQRSPNNSNNSPSGAFKLKIKPVMNSKYRYETVNETETIMTINAQEAKDIYKSDIRINYNFLKDSSGFCSAKASFFC